MAENREGSTINETYNSNEGTVSVNSITSVLLLGENINRLTLIVSNPYQQGLFLRKRDATDSLKDAIYIAPGGRYEMQTDNIHRGSFSIIMSSGGTKAIPFSETSK